MERYDTHKRGRTIFKSCTQLKIAKTRKQPTCCSAPAGRFAPRSGRSAKCEVLRTVLGFQTPREWMYCISEIKHPCSSSSPSCIFQGCLCETYASKQYGRPSLLRTIGRSSQSIDRSACFGRHELPGLLSKSGGARDSPPCRSITLATH